MAEKIPLEVKEQVKEILYDVMNKTHLTGNAREAEDPKRYEAASKMKASMDEDDLYQLERSLATAFSGLKSILGEYLDEETTTTGNLIEQEIENEGELKLTFMLPSNFNSASADSLGKGIHAYLVDMIIGDWFVITNKADAEGYYSHAAVSLETVRRALYKRSRPKRPVYES